MDGKGTAEKVARDMVERYGPDAPRILRERAVVADGCGDHSEAETWRKIDEIAERIAAGSEDAIERAERSFLRSASRHSRCGHDFNESCSCHNLNHTQRLPSRIARAVVIHVSVCAG